MSRVGKADLGWGGARLGGREGEGHGALAQGLPALPSRALHRLRSAYGVHAVGRCTAACELLGGICLRIQSRSGVFSSFFQGRKRAETEPPTKSTAVVKQVLRDQNGTGFRKGALWGRGLLRVPAHPTSFPAPILSLGTSVSATQIPPFLRRRYLFRYEAVVPVPQFIFHGLLH
jgi:hypothetical protein